MEHYSAIQRKELQTCGTTWMGLKNVVMSETNQIKRLYIIGVHLYKMTRKDKSTETDNIAWGWEWEQ